MPDTDALLASLEWFAAALTDPYAASDVLHMLVQNVGVVIGASGAGVLLVRQGRYVYTTSSRASVAALERVVEKHQLGPCVEAGNSRRAVAVKDLRAGAYLAKFPAYVAEARRRHIRAVACVPMLAGETSIGALGLYERDCRDWSTDDLRVAAILAKLASSYVVHAKELDEQRRLTGQLQHALNSRIVIEQAKGVVAVQRGVGIDQAFELMRKRARDNNERLRDVCAEVVSHHQG